MVDEEEIMVDSAGRMTLSPDSVPESIDADETEDRARLSMMDLPDDVLLRIFRCFDAIEITWLSSVCRRWYTLCQAAELWREIDFGYETVKIQHD
jgi:hypothetical protein